MTDPITITEIITATTKHADRLAIRHKRDGAWREWTYAEFEEESVRLARGFVAAGIAAGDKVCILAETRPEWTFIDYALTRAGAVVVPIYPTSTAEECAWVISDSGAVMVVCEDEEQRDKVESVRGELGDLKEVVMIDAPGAEDGVLTVDDIAARCEETPKADVHRRTSEVRTEDPWSIVYTSGTTGPPKGCVITHGNMAAFCVSVRATGAMLSDDVAYVFLPLAHLFARMIQLLAVDAGASVAYFGGDITKVVDELAEVRPTVLPSVPRIFEKIYTKATVGAADAGGLKKTIFDWAVSVGAKKGRLAEQGKTPSGLLAVEVAIADKLVFHKVRDLFGGRIRFCLSGAAPISAEILEFFYGCGIVLVEGYGMTESSAGISLTPMDRPRFGTVGQALPGVEIRINDDGEVCAKGPNIIGSYYRNEAATAETFIDGWLHTGDLGEMDADGYLTITGRKKDIIITAGGKNLTPANLENGLKRSRWISQAVMVGDRRPYPVAVITLDPDEIMAYAEEHGLPKDLGQLARHPDVRALIQSELDEVNAKQSPVARIKKFAILEDDLSIEAGELTPTMKVKRKNVIDHRAAAIEEMYAG